MLRLGAGDELVSVYGNIPDGRSGKVGWTRYCAMRLRSRRPKERKIPIQLCVGDGCLAAYEERNRSHLWPGESLNYLLKGNSNGGYILSYKIA